MDPNGSSLVAATAVFPNGVVVPIQYYASLGLNGENADAATGRFKLPIFPQPSNDYVYVQVETEGPVVATLEVVDLSGRRVRTEDFGVVARGTHPIRINIKDLAGGVYFGRLRLVGPTRTEIRLGRFVVAR
jgi:hypothetical protein